MSPQYPRVVNALAGIGWYEFKVSPETEFIPPNMSGLTTGFPTMWVGFARVWRRSCFGSIHRNIAANRLRSPRELVLDNDDENGTVPRPSSSPWYSIQDINDGGFWYRLKEYTAGCRPP